MNLYISDLHFGHSNVIRFDNRPFADVDEMDRTMIDLWNARVSQQDDVFIVGDLIYKSEKDPVWYLERLRGHKHLILGNHDSHITENPKALSYIETIDKMMHVADNGNQIVLCHYPLAEWYKSRHGSWLIYGHIHNKKEETYDYMRTRERALNAAACINNYTPVSFNELVRNNMIFQENS